MAITEITIYLDPVGGVDTLGLASNRGSPLKTLDYLLLVYLPSVEPTLTAALAKRNPSDPTGSEYILVTYTTPSQQDGIVVSIFVIQGLVLARGIRVISGPGVSSSPIRFEFLGLHGTYDGLNPPVILFYTFAYSLDAPVTGCFLTGSSYLYRGAVFRSIRVANISGDLSAQLGDGSMSISVINSVFKDFYPYTGIPDVAGISSTNCTLSAYQSPKHVPYYAIGVSPFGPHSVIQSPEAQRGGTGAFLPTPDDNPYYLPRDNPWGVPTWPNFETWVDDATYTEGRANIPQPLVPGASISILSGTGCRVLGPVTNYRVRAKITTVGVSCFELPAAGDVVDSTPLDAMRTIEVRASNTVFTQTDTNIPWVTWVRDSLNPVVEGSFIQFRITLLDNGVV